MSGVLNHNLIHHSQIIKHSRLKFTSVVPSHIGVIRMLLPAMMLLFPLLYGKC